MENLLEKSLTPKNDLQELWELSGRVKAILAWMEEDDPYIKNNVLAVMLGAPMKTSAMDTEPKDVLSRIGIIPKPLAEETEDKCDGEETEEGSVINGKD